VSCIASAALFKNVDKLVSVSLTPRAFVVKRSFCSPYATEAASVTNPDWIRFWMNACDSASFESISFFSAVNRVAWV
jgi:hypothetical protein